MAIVYGVGSNKSGELGAGHHQSCPYWQPIYLYVYNAISESDHDDDGSESNHPPVDVPASLQVVVSKIPDDIAVHALRGVRAGSCGASFTVLQTDDGNCLFAGLNDSGQLGLDALAGKLPMPLFFNVLGRNQQFIQTISCGYDHTVHDSIL